MSAANSTWPFDENVELCVLGMMLEGRETALQGLELLTAKDFERTPCQQIFAAISTVTQLTDFVAVPIVSVELKRHKQDDAEDLLHAVTGYADLPQRLPAYCNRLKELTARRRLIRLADDLRKAAYDQTKPFNESLASGRATLEELLRGVQVSALDFTSLADIKETLASTTWLWLNWWPNGYLTLIVAEDGIGKSSLVQCLLESTRKDGPAWPDGTPAAPLDRPILYFDYDASQGLLSERDTRWAFANPHIWFPGKQGFDQPDLSDPQVLLKIRASCIQYNAAAIVVDPLTGAHSHRENSAQMGRLMNGFSAIARDLQIPFLVIHHIRKQGEMEGSEVTLDRIRGHSSIRTPARVIWALEYAVPGEPGLIRLKQLKNNIAGLQEPLGFHLDADGILFTPLPEERKGRSKVAEAIDFLREYLRNGMRPCKEVREAAYQRHIHPRALYKAKETLGIIDPDNPDSLRHTNWGLPEKRLKI